jgi:DNA (cytosine-5)-methyltransferase 1
MLMGAANHESPSLSALDREIIQYVRPGGNWTDVPPDVPSARLAQIREMTAQRGLVRTTYYGRLRWDQPAYTIATYYDRPGNGANIHPWEHRTLSHREAARLQSFPDSFVFFGTKTSIKRQIGNAVPPLMAFALGKLIGRASFIDLFAGAGGLSWGLQLAGLEALAAQELEPDFAFTYSQNHPETKMIVGDIRTRKTKAELFDSANALYGSDLDLIAGGPPCQGFSTAGWRQHSDERNALIYEYLDIISEMKPRLFVFENVEGILSMQNGRVVRELTDAFRSIGYKWVSEPWVAHCEQYGVPQMRRRVIIIGSRDAIDAVGMPDTFFDRCHGRRERPHHRQSKRYPITVAEALRGVPPLNPVIGQYFPSATIDTAFAAWATSEIPTVEFLERRGERGKNTATLQALPLLK